MIDVLPEDALFVQNYVIAYSIEGVLKSLSMCLTFAMYAADLDVSWILSEFSSGIVKFIGYRP